MIKTTVSIILTLLCVVTFRLLPDREEYAHGSTIARVASDRIKQAHRYHGIKFSTIESNGYGWFMREGQKCCLFCYEED